MVEFICEHEPRSNTCVALAFAQTGYEVVIGARLKRAAWACDSTEGYKGGNNIGEFRSRTIQKEMMKTQQAQMSLTVLLWPFLERPRVRCPSSMQRPRRRRVRLSKPSVDKMGLLPATLRRNQGAARTGLF